MRKFLVSLIVLFALPLSLMAQDFTADADAAYAKGGLDNLKKSTELYAKAVQANPSNFEVAWKASRACRAYANLTKESNVAGWKDLCKKYGKLGMDYAEKAQKIDPNKAEGFYYYGLAVGSYADGVSIVTALKEGLKGKTQSGFENAYAKNKMYDDGGPILALGRFWMVLPWPMKDNKKAEQYIREYVKLFPNNAESQCYLGELLIDMKKKDEAKTWLNKAAASSNRYWAAEAKRLLSGL